MWVSIIPNQVIIQMCGRVLIDAISVSSAYNPRTVMYNILHGIKNGERMAPVTKPITNMDGIKYESLRDVDGNLRAKYPRCRA